MPWIYSINPLQHLAKLVIEEQKVNSREEKIDIHVEGKVLCV